MGSVYALFPTLTSDLYGRIRFQSEEFEFFYSSGYDELPLQGSIIDGNGSIPTYSLSDPHGRWNPDTDNWGFSRTVKIVTPSFLFGQNGIAPSGSRIGIAIIWISATSKQRGVIRSGQFENGSQAVSQDLHYSFRPMQLRGRVDFTTVLYLAKADTNISGDEAHLANIPGTILGELERDSVILDGEGSFFPIVEVNEPVQPMWYLNLDWSDPLEDSFSETVRLNLNRAHKGFALIDPNSPTYDESLMKEIMASALTIIITTLQKDEVSWNDIVSGSNLEHGSVGEAVNYFINTLNWNVQNPEAISVSVRKYFDRTM